MYLMKKKASPTPIYLAKFILLGTVLCCFLGCQKTINKDDITSGDSEIDSITSWINKARSSKTALADKRLHITKAYSSVKSRKSDTATLALLSRIQWTYMMLGDSLQFRLANKHSSQLAQDLQDSARLGISYWDLGTFLKNQNRKDSAFIHLTAAHNIFASLGHERKAGQILLDIAILQSKVKDYTGSEENAIKAVELFKPIDDYKMLYNCYNLLGSVAKDLKNYEGALKQYDAASSYLEILLEEEANKYMASQFNNNLGNVYREMGNYESAISFYEKALAIEGLEQDWAKLYARALNNLAYSKFLAGNHNDVENQLKSALNIRIKEEDLEGISNSSYYLAEYFLSKNNSTQARVYALEAKNYAELSSNNDRLLETYLLLSKLDNRNAAQFFEQHQRLSDSLLLTERQIRNKFARIQFETDEIEAENQLLARQRQVWIGIAVGLFLLALAVFIIISQSVRNQKLRFQQQQQETNNEIFSLMLAQNQKIEEGKKSEQKRISEELHDGVLGEMNGARMILMGLNQKTDEEAINMRTSAIAKLQEIQEEIRTISHELSDAAYQKFHNFIISIQELVTSVGNSASIAHSFTYDEQVDWDNLSAEITINLYRIVQECLMNCVKHSGAKNIFIDFSKEAETLLVQIEDDGKGFDTKKSKKGIGHKNISSRVEKVSGSWLVNSAKGEGTLVTIRIPLVYSTPQLKEELISTDK